MVSDTPPEPDDEFDPVADAHEVAGWADEPVEADEFAVLPDPTNDPAIDERPCEDCGRINPVWFASNELWNRVMGDQAGLLCPVCFIERAERQGIRPTGWLLTEEAAARAVPATPTEPDERIKALNDVLAFIDGMSAHGSGEWMTGYRDCRSTIAWEVRAMLRQIRLNEWVAESAGPVGAVPSEPGDQHES